MIRTIYVLAKHNDAFDAQVNEALEEGYEIETIELITKGTFMDGNMLYALLIKKGGDENDR